MGKIRTDEVKGEQSYQERAGRNLTEPELN